MSVSSKQRRYDEVPNVPSLGASMKQAKKSGGYTPCEGTLAVAMKQGGRYPGKASPNYIGATMKQSGGAKKK